MNEGRRASPLPQTPTSEQLLADPETSRWLREARTAALLRDPADAALDALILHDVLVERFDTALAGLARPAGEA